MRKDTIQHFSVCLLATLVVTLAFHFTGASVAHSEAAGVACALGLGFGKEYGDSRSYGNHFCFEDLLADALGCVVSVLATVFIL